MMKPDMGQGKKVMIVEDNELNMKLFHDLLEAHGVETIQARDGKNVLALARQHKPDLVLMDIQLPEVSGLDITKWLKEDDELKTIPVIAVTAFAMKGDEQKIREGGCEDYISKPISVIKFIETVQKYLVAPKKAEEPAATDSVAAAAVDAAAPSAAPAEEGEKPVAEAKSE